MSMLAWLITYAGALLTFLVVDLIWLGVVARDIYRSRMGDLLADQPNWPVAFAFYALYVAGVLFFAVHPAIDAGSVARALVGGAFFGLVAYATYDLTALAVLKGHSGTLAVIDMAWGATLTAVVSFAGYVVGRAVG